MFNSRWIHRGLYVFGTGITSGILYLGYISATVMRESPDDAVKRFEYKSVLTDKDICALKLKGVVVVDNVLSKEQLHSVREEINVILNRKRTFIANGFQINDQEDLTIRSDLVLWICETVSDEHRTNILGEALMRTLRQIRSIPVSIVRIQFLYTVYLFIILSIIS